MANHKSAVKRAKQNEKQRIRNRSVKTRVKNVVKAFNTALTEEAAEGWGEKLKIAQATLDKAAKKSVIHRRTAARKLSRMARKFAASSPAA